MQKWEYLYLDIPDECYKDTLEYLNRAGHNGWEFTGHTYDTGNSTQFLMKRSKL